MKQQAKVKELEAAHFTDLKERLRYTGEYRDAKRKVEQLVTDLDTACQDAARLREALQFYADPQTYGISGGTIDRIIQDAGKQAQQALKGA